MESYATAQQVFAGGLIFARFGAIIMLIPGIGEAFIPPRVRLSFAFALTLLLFPTIAAGAPALPASAGGMIGEILREVLIGLLIGSILRMFMVSLATAGEMVSIHTTLAFSQTANPAQAQPSTTLGTFLNMLGLVLLMVSNLHHLFLAAMVKSYTLFPFGGDVPVADAAQLAVQTMSRSFALGMQLAAPVIVFSIIFNVALGLVNRVLPQFQVFFVGSPLTIIIGLSLFSLSLGLLGMVWIDRYRELLGMFGVS